MSRATPAQTLKNAVPAAARTAAGTGAAVPVPYAFSVLGILNVTASSGTGATLAVTIESSPDGTTGWTPFMSFPARAVGALGETRVFGDRLPFYSTPGQGAVRAVWTIAGTSPSFTFSVDIKMNSLY